MILKVSLAAAALAAAAMMVAPATSYAQATSKENNATSGSTSPQKKAKSPFKNSTKKRPATDKAKRASG